MKKANRLTESDQTKSVSSDATTLTYNEISLLLFALEGGAVAQVPGPDSCEEACPIVESVEELLCGGTIDPRQQLVRHLNNHIREAMIECGGFDLMASPQTTGGEQISRLQMVNERLSQWSCQIRLNQGECELLRKSLRQLPKMSWITMPKTLWRLKTKLKE